MVIFSKSWIDILSVTLWKFAYKTDIKKPPEGGFLIKSKQAYFGLGPAATIPSATSNFLKFSWNSFANTLACSS